MKARKIKVSLRQIQNLFTAISSLSSAKKVKQVVRNRLARIQRKFKIEIDVHETNRQTLVKELGEPDPDSPGGTRVKKENHAKFNEQIQIALNEELELEFKPIALSELEGCEHDNYQNIVSALLDTVLIDDEDEEEEEKIAEDETKVERKKKE